MSYRALCILLIAPIMAACQQKSDTDKCVDAGYAAMGMKRSELPEAEYQLRINCMEAQKAK